MAVAGINVGHELLDVPFPEMVEKMAMAIAHGQMAKHELEDAMIRFIAGDTDVLICSTIIESGIDIPNANTIIIERDALTAVPTAIVSADGIRSELSIDADNHLKRVTYADGSYYDFEYDSNGLMLREIDPAGNSYEHAFDDKGRLKYIMDGEGGHWRYTRFVDENSHISTEVLSAEDNLTYLLDYTDSTGKYTSTVTDAAGSVSKIEQSDDGLAVNKSLPCGTDLEYIFDLDSEYRYKFAKQMTESTPALLERVTTIEKTYTDTNEDDISDLIVDMFSGL